MTGFLTVEDINSVLFEFGCVSVFHEIDTSLITDEYDFDGIKYDFCTVSRETDGSSYDFTFKVENALWTGGYYCLDGNGDYIDSDATYNNATKVLSITADTSSITLVLHLNNYATFSFDRLLWKPLNMEHIRNVPNISTQITNDVGYPLYFEFLNNNDTPVGDYTVKNSSDTTRLNGTLSLKEDNIYTMDLPHLYDGLMKITVDGDVFPFVNEKVYHSPYPATAYRKPSYSGGGAFHNIILGKNNLIRFTVPGNLISGYDVNCENISLTNQTYEYFNLDCSNWSTEKNVVMKIHTLAKNGLYEWDYEFAFPCVFLSVGNLSDFTAECGDGGTHTFKLNSNLTLTGNVNITHDLRVIGQEHTIDLNGYGFVLSDGVKVSFENIDFVDGDTAITQNKGTELTLTNCSFTNCQSTNYNNLGSCVYCDVDIESLNNPNDFITVIDNCTFIDNQNCILSGGRLTVTNSRLHNTDVDYIDKHNVAFLYLTDGNATLKYNVFDIDYDTDELCSNEENIGFAQALIQIGTTARVNGATSTQLLEDNKLPFSDNVYQNASHIFAKYYYPQIESCVYTSPILDKEDKAVCYTVTGENWIWKQNVQVTRASWDSQNEIRKITWED